MPSFPQPVLSLSSFHQPDIKSCSATASRLLALQRYHNKGGVKVRTDPKGMLKVCSAACCFMLELWPTASSYPTIAIQGKERKWVDAEYGAVHSQYPPFAFGAAVWASPPTSASTSFSAFKHRAHAAGIRPVGGSSSRPSLTGTRRRPWLVDKQRWAPASSPLSMFAARIPLFRFLVPLRAGMVARLRCSEVYGPEVCGPHRAPP